MKELKNIRKTFIIFSLAILVSLGLIIISNQKDQTQVEPAAENQLMPALSGKNAIEQLKQNGEYESLAAAFTAARYDVSQSDENAIAVNYANQMRATFSPAGLLLESNLKDASWRSRWRLQNLGYGENQVALDKGEVRTNGNRVTIDHKISTQNESAIVEEWFNNTPDGLEHGFTLSERLSESTRNLRLTIVVEGDLTLQADADGQTLRLVDKQNQAILNYKKLKVWDADGTEIAARMTTENGAVVLEIEDAAAKYPVVIDPTFSAAAQLIAFDGGPADWFGTSVAISGDTVVVGAPGDDIGADMTQGSAYVFERGADRLWALKTKLMAPDGEAGDQFGGSVAVSGDTVIIGARYDDLSGSSRGSAHVFIRTANWVFQQKLTATDNDDGDRFGESVAISGEYAIVGAPADDVGGNIIEGSAYVFVRTGSSWTQQQKLTAVQGEGGDGFGSCVAIAGSNAIIGAPSTDIVGDPNQGAAYVFTRSGTTWTQQDRLWLSGGAESDFFGTSVGISLGFQTFATVIVGADGVDINGNENQGSAYVFTRSGDIWQFRQQLTAVNGGSGDRFGTSVGISGGTAIVGANFSDANSVNQGSAYIFTRVGGTTWTERQRLLAFDAELNDFFGSSVAISGDTAIVGAEDDKIGANYTQGSAHISQLGSKPFDFDDDGKTDLSIFRPAPGEWWYLKSSDGANAAFQFGASSDRIVPADFTGDGKTDAAVWRPSNGNWFILRSEDFSYYSFPFGTTGDIPAPADFDGDGKADAAVFRASNATWYISNSSGGTTIQQFGANGDVPAVGDYDADGRADLAIFRPSNGQWWINRSSNATTFALTFGVSSDKPTPGDYTGDGKTDIAFWRPSTGEWFILRSQDFSFYSFPFGANGDIPAPGDYDNDGKFDATVFRPSTSTWYSQRTTAGTLIQQFGVAGDKPVPSAFIP